MAYSHKRHNKSGGLFATIKELVVLLLIVFLVRTFIFSLYQVPTGSMETTMLVGERFFADKMSYLFTKPKRSDIIALNDPTYKFSTNTIVRTYQEYVGWPVWPWGPINWTKRVIGIPGDHIKGTVEDGKPVVYLNGKKLDETYLNKYPLILVFDRMPEDGKEIQFDWRTYDPSKPFEQQDFYKLNPKLVVRHAQLAKFFPEYLESLGNSITVTPEGYVLQEPRTQIPSTTKRMTDAAGNYWTASDEFDVKLGANQYWLMGDNRRGSIDCRFFGPIEGRLIHARIVFRIWSNDSSASWWILDLLQHPIKFFKHMRFDRFFQRVR